MVLGNIEYICLNIRRNYTIGTFPAPPSSFVQECREGQYQHGERGGKMKRKLIILLAVGITIFLSYGSALADGIIIPVPPICDPCPIPHPMSQLSIRYHHVTVSIKDQIATTHVDQVFYNPNDWQVEGDYVFPIPRGATISNFILWIDGEPVEGEILEAEQARKTYEDIVANLRDPALLEYAEQDAVRARIFPIPSKGERRIELQYSQVLTAEDGLVHYLYPLGTEKFSVEPLESVSVSVDIESGQPIRAVYSPSHKIFVSRESEFRVKAGYEEQDVLPVQDFSMIYSIGESEAFHLLSYRDPSDREDEDGFFLLLLAPALGDSVRSIPKDVVIVVDQSGSMEGEKFEQARQALLYILNHLNPEDRYNIISFSTGIDLFSQKLIPASDVEGAISWVNRLRAGGSTDINRALLEAASLIADQRPAYLIFITDGLPTVGEVESEKIISNMQEFAPGNVSLFPFGVGYDVDTYLLDSLAQNHHGSSTYVLPGEALDETLSAFYNKISTPVLTDLELDFGEMPTHDIYPDPLPDLFRGSQIAVVGRYDQEGVVDVTLSGSVNGTQTEFIYPDQVFSVGGSFGEIAGSEIPSLWATRKIGYLLQQVRLHGPEREIIDEIVQLSIRYGIVTPYTSYLVTEPSILGGQEQERIVTDELQKFNDLANAPTFGQEAVEQAEGQNSLANADAAPSAPVGGQNKVKITGSHAFVDTDGVWTDTRYDPERMEPIPIEFLSEGYFSLVRENPDLARAFALGPQVIAVSGDKVYQVTLDEIVEEIQSTPVSNQEIQITPSPTTPDQVQEATPTSNSPTSAQLRCFDQVIIGLLPLLAIGILRIRRR